MTRPDQGPTNKQQGQPNPFDTGLPMLRLPAPPTGKRRRRRPAARRSGTSSGAPLHAPEPPRTPPRPPEPPHTAPPAMPQPFYGPELSRPESPRAMPQPPYDSGSPRPALPFAERGPSYEPESPHPASPRGLPEFYGPELPRPESPGAMPQPPYDSGSPRPESPVGESGSFYPPESSQAGLPVGDSGPFYEPESQHVASPVAEPEPSYAPESPLTEGKPSYEHELPRPAVPLAQRGPSHEPECPHPASPRAEPQPFYDPESPLSASQFAAAEPFYEPGLPRIESPYAVPEGSGEPEPLRPASRFAEPDPSGEPESPRAEPPPARQSPRRMGEWAEWLDPPIRSEEPAESPTVEIRVPVDEEPELERGADDDAPLIPAIIDRTGGNPGPALRRPRPRQQEQQPERGNKILAVLIVLGVLVAVGSILWAVLPSSGNRAAPTPTSSVPVVDDARPTVSPTPTGPESPAAVATPGCEQRRTGDVVSGTGVGGTTDGPSAILAFERAYYVQRSGIAARAVVAADATVPPAEQIQRGIDQVPVGTRYCVQITRTATGAGDSQSHWEVRLTQQYPDQLPKTFTQIITTKTVTGRTVITGISMA
ncbi:hypothetical protein [Nocardia xishanensis]|uniref:hypothetical protein n=1 Tax=Nocardia xishanensis TaxID=238964 RepID=UPI00342952F2